jgi:hypothetical protein
MLLKTIFSSQPLLPSKSVSQESVSHEPVSHEPESHEPVSHEPVSHELGGQETVSQESVSHKPVSHEPVGHETASQEPVSYEPVSHEPVSQEPVGYEPVGQETISQEPVNHETGEISQQRSSWWDSLGKSSGGRKSTEESFKGNLVDSLRGSLGNNFTESLEGNTGNGSGGGFAVPADTNLKSDSPANYSNSSIDSFDSASSEMSSGKKKNEHKRSRIAFKLFKTPIAEFSRRLKLLKANKNQKAPDDFYGLLTAWELTCESSIQRAVRELRVRILAFAAAGALGGTLIIKSGANVLAILAVGPALLGIITSVWRLRILKHRRFVGFSGWIKSLGGVGKEIKSQNVDGQSEAGDLKSAQAQIDSSRSGAFQSDAAQSGDAQNGQV